ncbi:MAG: hypothetical protein JW991_03780 [Candidatus Pacebacteria bacterium]|nr:hypothetical protein [Candidatus Paceibacterota bacterium]
MRVSFLSFKTKPGRFLAFLLLWGIFYVAARQFLDPDLGWHLKTGEWIWQNRRLPEKDLFSYTMPDYSWRLHSWSGTLIFYLINQQWGYQGMLLFSSLVLALAFWLAAGPKKIVLSWFPLSLASLAGLSFVAPRPRVIGILLAAVVFGCLRISWSKPAWLLLVPPVFGIWANLHGGFPLGLVIFFWAIISQLILFFKQKKKLSPFLGWLGLAFLFSVGATLINPYGFGFYQEVFGEMAGGQKVHLRIGEWLPYSQFDPAMIVFTSLFLVLAFFLKKSLSFWEKTVSFGLLLATLFSARFLIYYLLFALPLLVRLIKDFLKLVSSHERFQLLVLKKSWFLGGIVTLFLVSLTGRLISFGGLSEKRFYPQGAVAFLGQEKISGNLFSIYNWGGYLIWKFPGKRVFVDGRMLIWQEDGYSAFEQELRLKRGEEDFQAVFEKYQISHALLAVGESASDPLLVSFKNFLGKTTPNFDLGQELLAKNWRLIYKDEVAQVLEKP